ncbi:hypothetical protein ABFG95_02465 [Achromobacter sp. HNDS-1]|uniref:Uncharacterized protein n=2 Tax=Achromobacter TaxID=222 RepID=A0AAU7LBV6_9BURK
MHTNPDRAPAPAGKKRIAGLLAVALGLALGATTASSLAGDLPPRGGGAPQAQTQQPTQQQAQPQDEGRLPPRGTPAQQAPARTSAPAPAQAQPQVQAPAGAQQKTEIKSQAAYERLLHNSGISVQWLWTDERGKLNAVDDNDVVRLEGGHANENGSVTIKGQVLSISADRFTFRGTILIVDAPDKGRRCERTGDYEFRATGKRKYWRLQQMEACGGLTDYVDIYY